MNEEMKVSQSKTFPWGALAIYIVVALGSAVFEFFVLDTVPIEGFEVDAIAAVGVIGLTFGVGLLLIGTLFQYALTKFPTQWVSKEEYVYKYDIWSALFLSNAVGVVINFIIGQLGYADSLFIGAVSSAVTTALFLFFYFSGEEKESHIKRAIVIVRIVWFVVGIIFLIALQVLANNILL